MNKNIQQFLNLYDVRPYKEININSKGKLKYFLDKHSTKEGAWARLDLHDGEIDFIFQNGESKEITRHTVVSNSNKLMIPPASWHKIEPKSPDFNATLTFYCKTHRYVEKKYHLPKIHSDLLYVYQNYLVNQENLNILDVGCGKGRNTIYFSLLNNQVTGIDINESSINYINEIVQKENLSRFQIIKHDLNTPLNLNQKTYDFIYSTVTLQFLNESRITSLLTELQKATTHLGMHFLVFPIKEDLYTYPDSFTYLAKINELYEFYQDSGWAVLEYNETVGHLHKTDKTGKPMQGLFGQLLAQKID